MSLAGCIQVIYGFIGVTGAAMEHSGLLYAYLVFSILEIVINICIAAAELMFEMGN